MIRRFALPLLLLAAAPVPVSGGPGFALAEDAEARWIPFRLTPANQIRFDLEIDGRAASAVLDTGVTYSMLSQQFAAEHGLRLRAGGSAAVVGGAVDYAWTDVSRLAFGALVRRGGSLIVGVLPAQALGGGTPVDLLVGRDVIGDYALDIDYAGRRFRLLPSGRLPFAGTTAPLAISPDRRLYTSELMLGPARLRPIIVDTGDGAAVTVTAGAWRAAGMAAVATTTGLQSGLAGTASIELGVAPEVRIGELVARQVEVQIEPQGGFSDSILVAGRLGSGFLQHYRVLLDPGAGRMVLRVEGQGRRETARWTSGLMVQPEGDRLRVLHVMRGGPGEADGWQAGETICAIDGAAIPHDYWRSPVAGWSAGTPGRVVRLGTCDGAERHLTLKTFY